MADNYQNQNMFLDWDDAIENDGQEFVTLEEGDYNFTVTGFERGRFPGGPKIPACNKAALTLQVQTADGIAIIHTDLLLYRSLEWRISAFLAVQGPMKTTLACGSVFLMYRETVAMGERLWDTNGTSSGKFL